MSDKDQLIPVRQRRLSSLLKFYEGHDAGKNAKRKAPPRRGAKKSVWPPVPASDIPPDPTASQHGPQPAASQSKRPSGGDPPPTTVPVTPEEEQPKPPAEHTLGASSGKSSANVPSEPPKRASDSKEVPKHPSPLSLPQTGQRSSETKTGPGWGADRHAVPLGLDAVPEEVPPQTPHKREPSWTPLYVPEDVKRTEEGVSSNHSLGKRGSVLLPVLEDSEKLFHELVASGDVDAARAFLTDSPGFNINCSNYQKITALHVAVRNQDEVMVEFLLSYKTLDLGDSVLHCVRTGNIRILEMLLDRLQTVSPGLEFTGTTHSVDFADDLTPLILAAQMGQYEMIDLLMKRGHSIPEMHPPTCGCGVCKLELNDHLRFSTMKLNLYKAVANPKYLFHSTSDPIRRAFELTKELQQVAVLFPQFHTAYKDLWTELRSFSVELMGCCRNSSEVRIVLKQPGGCLAASTVIFPRLQMAVDLKQKEFVAHPYTQAVLDDVWFGDLVEWKTRTPVMQSLSVVPRIVMLPVIALTCMVITTNSAIRRWSLPFNKLISSSASYMLFLLILFIESNMDKRKQLRGPPNSGWEPLIVIYVLGYVWSSIMMCVQQGAARYFQVMWNWYDMIWEMLFLMTFFGWAASAADVAANDQVDLPRKYWNASDPELISEGLFAIATIMAFFRLNLYLSLNYYLGPLQVSIGKMTLDILRFITLFSLIILAWCAGVSKLYQPYEGMTQKDAAGASKSQVSSFVSFPMTLKTFFWAIFGMSPVEAADVVIENLDGDTPEQIIINTHGFTEAIGYISYATFQFLSAVVVMNMLVACMANTFTKVIDNVGVEWVFGRTQIYLMVLSQTTLLPPPFNLLPTAAGVKSVVHWLKLFFSRDQTQKAKCNLTHCCYIEDTGDERVDQQYPLLMSELAQRYLRLREETEEDANREMDELKCDLAEMRDTLRRLDKFVAS